MGTTSSSLYMTYVADVLMGSTHGFEITDIPFWANWPWTIPKTACRVAYMVLTATSMQQLRWDLDAGCVRISPPEDEDMVRQAVVKVAQAQIPLTRKWALEQRVGEALLRVHWDMHEAIEASDAIKIPLLLPSATDSHDQLMSDAARAACEDFLVRCTTNGWVDEMTDPYFMPKTLYEQDNYPYRAIILRKLIPHLHEELAKAACMRQGRETAREVLALARERFKNAEERDDPEALVASLVLKHVQSVQVNGADPSASSTYVIPEKKRKGVRIPEVAPSDGDAITVLTKVLADALRPAYLAREEAYVGGPGAARQLAESIVNSVYEQLRPGEDEKDYLYRAEMTNNIYTLGSILLNKEPPPPFDPTASTNDSGKPAGQSASASAVSGVKDYSDKPGKPAGKSFKAEERSEDKDYDGEHDNLGVERTPGILTSLIGFDIGSIEELPKLLAMRGDVEALIRSIIDSAPSGAGDKGAADTGNKKVDHTGGSASGAGSSKDNGNGKESDDKQCACVWELIDGTHKDKDSTKWSEVAADCIEKLPKLVEMFNEILRIVILIAGQPIIPEQYSKKVTDLVNSHGKSWKEGWKTYTTSMIKQGVDSDAQMFALLKERGKDALEPLLQFALEMLGYLTMKGLVDFIPKWKEKILDSKHYQKLVKVLGDVLGKDMGDKMMSEIEKILNDKGGTTAAVPGPLDAGPLQAKPPTSSNSKP